MEFVLVYLTFPNWKEAESAMQALLKEKLIACANIFSGATSLYAWKGGMKKEPEVVVFAKTSKSLFPTVEQRVKELHSYECPCILALPIEAGNEQYLQWMQSSLCV